MEYVFIALALIAVGILIFNIRRKVKSPPTIGGNGRNERKPPSNSQR